MHKWSRISAGLAFLASAVFLVLALAPRDGADTNTSWMLISAAFSAVLGTILLRRASARRAEPPEGTPGGRR